MIMLDAFDISECQSRIHLLGVMETESSNSIYAFELQVYSLQLFFVSDSRELIRLAKSCRGPR